MAPPSPADRLYKIAYYKGVDHLGGARAFAIAGPSIRRLAVGAAILETLAAQDAGVADATVRQVLDELYSRLVDHGAKDWL